MLVLGALSLIHGFRVLGFQGLRVFSFFRVRGTQLNKCCMMWPIAYILSGCLVSSHGTGRMK